MCFHDLGHIPGTLFILIIVFVYEINIKKCAVAHSRHSVQNELQCETSTFSVDEKMKLVKYAQNTHSHVPLQQHTQIKKMYKLSSTYKNH
jgi:hypothetical protein